MIEPNIGLAILAALNPRFPVIQAVRVLEASPRPTFNFLMGTFGKEWRNIERILIELEAQKKLPRRVGVYLDCGPCRRPRRDGTLNHIQPSLTIAELNRALSQKGPLRRRVLLSFRRRAIQLMRFAINFPEIEWRIYPVLEDNLTLEGFTAIFHEVSRIFEPTPIRFSVGRNRIGPIQGPWAAEVHTWEGSPLLAPGDAVSGDGVTRDPTPAEIRRLVARGVDVLLWRSEWQGVTVPPLSASKRDYFFRDLEGLRALMKCTNTGD